MRNSFKIGERFVGESYPPLVIAEIGINHGGSLEVAKEMVRSAKRAGAEIIKHQTHIVDDEMSSEASGVIPGNAEVSIYEIMKECSLTEEEEYELMEFTEEIGLMFFSSPFSREAFRRLERFGVRAYKIGSGECNNLPLLKEIAMTGKPIILSTGMNSIESIRRSLSLINEYHNDVALLHTTNLYPTPNKLVRLGAMMQMADAFPNNIFGLSDHTITNHACLGAVALGASIVERHFTDRMDRIGPDIICSMDENACSELIAGTKIIHDQRGGEKQAVNEEKVTIDFAFASVCTVRPIKKGELFTKDNIWVKRPGTGDYTAADYNDLLGRKAALNIENDVQIKFEDVK